MLLEFCIVLLKRCQMSFHAKMHDIVTSKLFKVRFDWEPIDLADVLNLFGWNNDIVTTLL